MFKKIIGGIMFFGAIAIIVGGIMIAAGSIEAGIIVGSAIFLAFMLIGGAHLLGFLD